VTDVKRNLALLAGAAAGAVAAVVVSRRRTGRAAAEEAPPVAPAEPDPRAEDLRRKLADARAGAADEDDFEAAGMGPETVVEDDADVAEARRRVHEAARRTAEDMRRAGDDPQSS
jgi:hypothetical protein